MDHSLYVFQVQSQHVMDARESVETMREENLDQIMGWIQAEAEPGDATVSSRKVKNVWDEDYFSHLRGKESMKHHVRSESSYYSHQR